MFFLPMEARASGDEEEDEDNGVAIIIGVTVGVLLVLIPLVVACVWFGTKKYDQLQEERAQRSAGRGHELQTTVHPRQTQSERRDRGQRRDGGERRVISVRDPPALLTVGGAEGSPRRGVSGRGQETSGRSQCPGRPVSTTRQKSGRIPRHEVLVKDENLKVKASELAENKEVLENEFRRLEEYVQNHIKKETKVANRDENRPHNRYTDIVPFDDNYIRLTSQTFTDANTSYVNASWIEFPGYPDNNFIATQAPRPNSIKHFWHMVIQAEVKVIVMITRLVEGSGSSKKKKADCYWPDKKVEGDSELGLEIDLGDGCKVQHVSTSYQGKYFQRKFSVWLPDGGIRQVTQIQTELWPDLSAPEGPRLLIDLLHRAQDLHVEADKNSNGRGAGPMLVHCSAGVGRTGTFLALYKLWLDYTNENVKSLAILPTVLSMRQQRCKTVQRAAQYVYIAKCLSHMLSSEKGDYYEC